jgi:Zn-dependent peptidase ImmA (M78 family)
LSAESIVGRLQRPVDLRLEQVMDANDVLNKHWDGTLPVDPKRIARAMDVEVVQEVGMNDYSGLVEIKNGQSVIHYDVTESPVRQRFTIAHEVGHIALGHLHTGEAHFRDPPDHFTTNQRRPKEAAANAFAAELLMPTRIVRYVLSEKKIANMERIANIFFVSQAAMRYRLINLGLLSPDLL